MQLVGFLAFTYVGMTLINRIMEGRFITGADVGIINNLTVFQSYQIFGAFTVPVPNLLFLTEGLPRLVKWDYSFFGGGAQII